MIYTFYSYKGGVGRSMALANVAECFYLQGLKVIIIDWDLEAPGLETFFFKPPGGDAEGRNEEASGTCQPMTGTSLAQCNLGLIDLLTEYKRSFAGILSRKPTPQLAECDVWMDADQRQEEFETALDNHLAPLSPYLVPIHPVATNVVNGSSGSLYLLPAGWRYGDRFHVYAEAVQAFNWEDFYASYRGKEFFDWLGNRLRSMADVILIDSRTGVTEMGGVCTRQMADVVVSLSAPNNQNLNGVARMIRSFKRKETIEARGNRELETIIVPSRVDPGEEAELIKFQSRFEKVAKSIEAPKAYDDLELDFWDLQIPYRTMHSYQECRVIGPDIFSGDPTKGLSNAYWKLASHMALLARENHVIRRQFGDRLLQEFPGLLPKVVLAYMADAQEDATAVRAFLQRGEVKIWPDLDPDDLQTSMGVISQAKHLVVILSASAQADDGNIRRHIRFARQTGKVVHLLQLSGERRRKTWLQSLDTYTSLTQEFIDRLRTSPREVRSPLIVPACPPHYVKRAELESKLKSVLLEAAVRGERTVEAVYGPAGCGKTVTTARVCEDDDIVDAYPGGIFFFEAAQRDVIEEMVRSISPQLRVQDDHSASDLLASLLRGRRCLIVLDDVWSNDDVAVKDLPASSTILLLTRDLRTTRSVGKVITCDVFSEEEASAFLPGASEVVERLGRWPLALSLVRASLQKDGTLQERTVAVQCALDRLRRHGVVAFDRAGTDRHGSVARSLEHSLNRLLSWERKRFEQLATLCTSGDHFLPAIQERWTTLPPGTGEPRPLNGRHLENLCLLLGQLRLISWDPATQRISLHNLVREYLLSQGVLSRNRREMGKGRISSGRDKAGNEDVLLAKKALAGFDLSFDDLVSLASRLKRVRYFSYARQILSRARRMPEASPSRLYLGQQHAICTYKDTDLPYIERADRALEILGEVEDLSTTVDQETLGLAGAIFKYKWAADGQAFNLQRSLAYYLRGYRLGIESDCGYTAINAAFVLDLIALQERQEAKKSGLDYSAIRFRQEEARKIREEIVASLPGLAQRPGKENLVEDWWYVATIAEAYFGLRRYDEARYWLREALGLEVPEWQFESTARQLAHLALVQNDGEMPPDDSPACHTLRIFVGNTAALRSVAIGKMGIALSGGGFRASLFHIGVLAKLAEQDILRNVEVVSCVSGGSIVAAHYYLEVKKLLETKCDDEITREDYVDLVKRVETDFMKLVQANLRTRLAANPLTSLKSLVLPHYSWTDKLGELLEKRLYSRITGTRKVFLNELLIRPKGGSDDFSPKLDNWQRKAKVPVLVINATTLNTGHNWQFTATWMGEPPAGVDSEVDGNDLLRRMYYWEAPKAHRAVRLGRAVAASACVPGLFAPIEFHGLYPKRIVRLVDGGVHDNQGIGGLIEQECSVLLVSDASGQMGTKLNPPAGPFQVPLRASSILGARVRAAQFRDLEERRRASQIKDLLFVHLKKDLDTDPVDWVDCSDPFDITDEARPKARRGPLTSYGILKSVQQRLAALRTDLDSFTDVEAYALMMSGYRMIEKVVASTTGIPTSTAQAADWRFLSVEKAMSNAKDFEDAHRDLMEMLKVGESMALKMWRLSRGMQVVGVFILFAAAAIAYQLGSPRCHPLSIIAAKCTGLLAALCGIVAISLWAIFRLMGINKPFMQLVFSFLTGTIGWMVGFLHLCIFDPEYLKWGRVKNGQFYGVRSKTAWWRLLIAGLAIILPIYSIVFHHEKVQATHDPVQLQAEVPVKKANDRPAALAVEPAVPQHAEGSKINLADYKIDIHFLADSHLDSTVIKVKGLIEQRFAPKMIGISPDGLEKYGRIGMPTGNQIRYDGSNFQDAAALAGYLNSKDSSLRIQLRRITVKQSRGKILTLLLNTPAPHRMESDGPSIESDGPRAGN